MYNRYIPQPDGSYRRNQVPETHQQNAPQNPVPQDNEKNCPPQDDAYCDQHPGSEQQQPPCRQGGSINSFLRQLLPKDLDTGDLLIIILLLLMAADNTEDQNTAMLTLALYLFL